MGRQAADITGQTFGKLEVIARVGSYRTAHATWQCRCQCGTMVVVIAGNLKSGQTKSCGCLIAAANKARRRHSAATAQALGVPKKTKRPRGVIRYLTHLGKRQGLQKWADEVGLSRQTIQFRLTSGWSVKAALTTPKREWTRKA